jgi:sucrose phosphorylase
VIITETNVPHKDNVSYFGDGENEAQMVYQFSCLRWCCMRCIVRMSNAEPVGGVAGVAFHKTTWFNFLASHDGIGLNPLRGILPESEILSLVEKLQLKGRWLTGKITRMAHAVLMKLM